jgi:hypothetical protein
MEQRQIDVVNELVIRVTVLENKHNDLVQVKDDHAALLSKLVDQDNKAIIALNNINTKFDALIRQFSVGFKIVMICGTIVSTSVAAFWIYNENLDARYSSKLDKIASDVDKAFEKLNK